MKVALFYLRTSLSAGSTTFTAHLVRGLQSAGHDPMVYHVADTGQEYTHAFGEYTNVRYKNVTLPQVKEIMKDTPSLLVAIERPPYVRDGVVDQLADWGAVAVVHDGREAMGNDWSRFRRCVCVRQAVVPLVAGSTWVAHPYARVEVTPASRTVRAVSNARVAAVKRTPLLLDANRLVSPHDRVVLLGMEDRQYSKQLVKDYADVYVRPQSGGPVYPLTFEAPVQLLSAALLNVDLSWFENDGGGTQYAQLEAMDAGCINVMHEDWFRFTGDLVKREHVLTVGSAQHLAQLLRNGRWDADGITTACNALLKAHDATTVAQAYVGLLTGA